MINFLAILGDSKHLRFEILDISPHQNANGLLRTKTVEIQLWQHWTKYSFLPFKDGRIAFDAEKTGKSMQVGGPKPAVLLDPSEYVGHLQPFVDSYVQEVG